MTKKRLLLIASLPLTIAVVLGVLAMLPPSPGVTKANFDRIEKGMMLAEVTHIFGVEPHPGYLAEGETVWKAGNGSMAWLTFANDGVAGKNWYDSHETFHDKIRRWLHLP